MSDVLGQAASSNGSDITAGALLSLCLFHSLPLFPKTKKSNTQINKIYESEDS